jgi:hypothetical protein
MLVSPVVMVLLLPTILTTLVIPRVLTTVLGTPELLAMLVPPMTRMTRQQEASMCWTTMKKPIANGKSDCCDRSAHRPLLLSGC